MEAMVLTANDMQYSTTVGRTNVNFCIQPGQWIALSGAPTSGAMSFFNVLAGKVQETRGALNLEGRPASILDPSPIKSEASCPAI